MQIKVKLLSVGGVPASDGSIIPREVFEAWLNSAEAKEAIASHKLLGALSHIGRAKSGLKSNFNPAASSTIGKEDTLLLVGNNTAPTHYIDNIWIDNDQWVWCSATILDPSVMDDEAVQNIKRLRGLLSNGVKPGVSAVILGYWDSKNSGSEELRKLVKMKGFDITLNPSWVSAGVEEIIPDGQEEKTFSEKDFEFDGIKAKTFSDLSSFGVSNLSKSSKINNTFTTLKGKVFSANGVVEAIDLGDDILTEKLASETVEQPITAPEETQKEFSAATLRERIRYGNPEKFSPRVRLRRLYIDYKQVVKQMGGPEKIDPATMKTMKSLFAADLNMLMAQITPDIVKSGKQINTVLGCSALGVVPRKAAQALQMPYRMAFMEMEKTGKISPARFTKIKEAYTEFIKAMTNEVFGSSPMPEGLENAAEEEEKEVK